MINETLLKSKIEAYRILHAQIQQLDEHLSAIRSEMLEICGNQEYNNFGLKINIIKQKRVLDWEKAIVQLGLNMEQLEPFFKVRPSSFRVVVAKEEQE